MHVDLGPASDLPDQPPEYGRCAPGPNAAREADRNVGQLPGGCEKVARVRQAEIAAGTPQGDSSVEGLCHYPGCDRGLGTSNQ